MQLIFPQQIADRSASSIGKATNGPRLAAAAEWVTLLEKKISPLHIVPWVVICHLLSWSEGACLSLPPCSWTSPPSLPALEGGCVFGGLSPLSLLILGITSAPAMTGEKTLMKGHSWPRNRWRRCFLQNICPPDFSNRGYEVQRATSCPVHNEMKAVLQPSSKKTNWYIPGAISGTFFKHICQVLIMYVQEMFQNMLPFHSFLSLQELALLTKVKKAFLHSVYRDMLLSLLSDRANVETFTALEVLSCNEFYKENNSTEFLLLPFTCLILQEAVLSLLSSLLTKVKALSSVCCLVFSFTCCFSKQEEMWFVGDICGEMKAPGLAQESSCVHIWREPETCKKQTSKAFGHKKDRQCKGDKQKHQKSWGNKTGSRQQSRIGGELSVAGEFG